MLETMRRALGSESWGFRPDLMLSEVEREAIASIGKLRGAERENEACVGRVLKQIAQDRIQAEGAKR
jgi:hypothetical protein